MEEGRINGGAEKMEEEAMLDMTPDLGEPTPEEMEAAKKAQRQEKRQEAIRRVKAFLLDNKDVLILAGQLTLVTIVCVTSIRNELTPNCCKKKRKKR